MSRTDFDIFARTRLSVVLALGLGLPGSAARGQALRSKPSGRAVLGGKPQILGESQVP